MVTQRRTMLSTLSWSSRLCTVVACILLPIAGRRREPMRQIEPVNARLLKVGLEVFPVYGDERSGWSMDPIDLLPEAPKWLRYDSLDELFFALLNLNVTPEGQA
jgi:hypothetical protein